MPPLPGGVLLLWKGSIPVKDCVISEAVRYIGVDDKTLDLFESQYIVPNGVSYNSYVILDEKVAVMDTADQRASAEWMEHLITALDGRSPNYLIVSHLEPDHSANIAALAEKYPAMQIVASAKAVSMLPQFFDLDLSPRCIAVKEGDTLPLGTHTLQFVMAPMIHWPEVMVTYEQSEKILFSADAFGKFGALDAEEDWTCEARRYYFNIVGKYGAQVQGLLKKAAALDIRTICPLHGPILRENLAFYLDKYAVWSSYQPEDAGVLVAYASIHGNTAAAARKFAEMLREKGVARVAVTDLSRDDMAEAVEDAFRYSHLVLAAASYDAGLFPCMDTFLRKLAAKSYQNRTVAVIENGSWAPSAGKCMRAVLEGMKNVTVLPETVTIRTTLKPDTEASLAALAGEIAAAL